MLLLGGAALRARRSSWPGASPPDRRAADGAGVQRPRSSAAPAACRSSACPIPSIRRSKVLTGVQPPRCWSAPACRWRSSPIPGKPGRADPGGGARSTCSRAPSRTSPTRWRARRRARRAAAAPPRAGARGLRRRAARSPRSRRPQTLAALLPEKAVVTDEAVTSGRGFFPFDDAARTARLAATHRRGHRLRHAVATGAAVGAPGPPGGRAAGRRRGMYTLQALWTQARENLDVTTVHLRQPQVCDPARASSPMSAPIPAAPRSTCWTSDTPTLDWVESPAAWASRPRGRETMRAFADLFAQAFARQGPFLIELVI